MKRLIICYYFFLFLIISPHSEINAAIAENKCPNPQLPTMNNIGHVGLFHVINLGEEAWIFSIAIDPNGSRAAIGDRQGTIVLVDMTSLTVLRAIETHSSYIVDLAFNPNDPSELASASRDRTIKLWDVDSGEMTDSLELGEVIMAIDYHRWRPLLVAASGETFGDNNMIRILNISHLDQEYSLLRHRTLVIDVEFFPDKEYIVFGDNTGNLYIWDFMRERMVTAVNAQEIRLSDLTIDPNGRYIITSGSNESVKVWDAQTLELITKLIRHENDASLVFNPDGSLLITGDSDGIVRIWDTNTWMQIVEIEAHSHAIPVIVFDPEGRYFLTGSADGTVRFWGICVEQ